MITGSAAIAVVVIPSGHISTILEIPEPVVDFMAIIPYPPSVNSLFNGGQNSKRRFTSASYKAWQSEAGVALMQQTPLPSIKGGVNVIYSFGRPDKRRRDVFNLEKAVSDLLVKWAVIEDDSLIESGTCRWDSDIVGCRVEVEAI